MSTIATVPFNVNSFLVSYLCHSFSYTIATIPDLSISSICALWQIVVICADVDTIIIDIVVVVVVLAVIVVGPNSISEVATCVCVASLRDSSGAF